MPPKANKPAAPKKPTKPSAKSKTGNTACSQAASNWQLSIRGKEPLDPQTYATLAKCRAMTRTAKQADDRARMGYNLNEQGAAALKGRLQKRFDQGLITQKSRDERLKMLLQQRKEKQAAVAAKPVTQTPEKLTGTRAVAQRFENAENKFVEHAMSHAGLTRPQAVTALNAMTKAKAVKIDPIMGQFSFTHGAFGDKAVIRRAAGIETAKPADSLGTAESYIGNAIQANRYADRLKSNPSAMAAFRQTTLDKWKSGVLEQAKTGRLSDDVLDSYESQFGRGSVGKTFRGVYEKGASGYFTKDIRTNQKPADKAASLVSSVRQKPGYGVARASAAGNRELVGFRIKEKAKPAQSASGMPPRTADTMSEAIALSSPNGRMSKRTKDAATKRLSTALFGPNGLQGPQVKQPTEIERLRRDAANLRDLASRGLKPRAHAKLADQFEARAIELEKASAAPKFSRQGQLAPGRGTKLRSEIAKQKWEDRPRRFLMGQTYLTKSGEPMLIHSKRQGYLTAFPYENGKPVVHSGSAIKFAYTDMAKKIAPDFRTDITNTPANLKETNNTTQSPKPFSRGGQLAPGRGTEERKKAAGILQNLRSRNNDGRALARTIRNDAVFTRRWNDKKHLISSDAGFKSRRILEQSYQQRVNAEAGYTDAQHAANKLVTKTGKVKESAIREANINYGSNVGLKQNAIARKLGSLRDSASRHLNNYRMLKQSGVSETSYIAKPKSTKEFLKNPLSRLRNAITNRK